MLCEILNTIIIPKSSILDSSLSVQELDMQITNKSPSSTGPTIKVKKKGAAED
jgi:hypothetical protein